MSKPFFSVHTLIVAIAAVLALIVANALWNYYMNDPWTRDGRVRADIVQIAPDVSGFLTEIKVADNQLVHAGDVLIVIDKSRYELALKQADAIVASRKAKMEQAGRDARRYEGMRNESISALDRDQKESGFAIATAEYQQALADQGIAQLNLERTTIKAPIDGYVSNFDLRIGNYETAGHPVFALVAANSFYIAAYMEETKLQRVQPGDSAIVRLMGGAELRGHVESVARGIVDRERNEGPDLLANVNPTFSWVRLAQRIPVRIALDTLPDDVRLVAGQTATVTVTPKEH